MNDSDRRRLPEEAAGPASVGWPGLLIATGLVVVVLGFVLQASTKPSDWLSEDLAGKYLEAAVALHGETTHDHTHGEDDALPEARQRLAAVESHVEAARLRGRWLPRGLQAAGAVLAGVGLIARQAKD